MSDDHYAGDAAGELRKRDNRIEDLEAEVKKLAIRIHNQRVALRDNWNITEMRILEGCMAPKSPLRSKWWGFIKNHTWTKKAI